MVITIHKENVYLGNLFHRRGKLYQSLRKRYPSIINYLETHIDNNTCPFCKKKFKKQYALISHLRHRTECSRLMVELVEKMIERLEEEDIKKYMGLTDGREEKEKDILYYAYSW